jgi:hypothetical protein
MYTNTVTVHCLVLGDIPPDECVFLINISAEKTVFELKKMIKTEKINEFANIDADKLKLWKVNIPLYTPNEKLNALKDDPNIDIEKVLDGEVLRPVSKICKAFPNELSDECIHVIVQRPVNIVSFQWIIGRNSILIKYALLNALLKYYWFNFP